MTKSLLGSVALLLLATACKREPPPPNPTPPPRVLATALPSPTPPTPIAPPDAGAPLAINADGLALPDPEAGHVDHLQRIQDLEADGDYANALAEGRRALASTPEDLDVLDAVAHDAKLAHRPRLAAAAYHRLAALEPDDASPLVQEARAWAAAGNLEGAKQSARQAIDRDEASAEAYQVLGRAQLAGGELPKAIVSFETAVKLDPEYGYALNNLGFAYLLANRNQDALQVLTQASELLPNVSYVSNNLGIALERLGKRDEARAAYDRAAELDSGYVNAQLNAQRLRLMASAAEPVPRDDKLDAPDGPASGEAGGFTDAGMR